MDLEWGGTIHRAGHDVAVCHLFDDRQTSYARDAPALRRFLATLRDAYATVSFVGSSRGAYGALRYADLATATVLALSPLRGDIRWRAEDNGDFAGVFPGDVAARLRIHVGARNRRDAAVADLVARHYPGAATVVRAPSAAHGPDLYRPAARLDALVRGELAVPVN